MRSLTLAPWIFSDTTHCPVYGGGRGEGDTAAVAAPPASSGVEASALPASPLDSASAELEAVAAAAEAAAAAAAAAAAESALALVSAVRAWAEGTAWPIFSYPAWVSNMSIWMRDARASAVSCRFSTGAAAGGVDMELTNSRTAQKADKTLNLNPKLLDEDVQVCLGTGHTICITSSIIHTHAVLA